MRPSPDPIARAALRLSGLGRPALLLAGIWALGLVALAAVVTFESRADETRRAQVVIAQMKNQAGAILAIAFNPAIAGASYVPARAQTAQQLAGAKGDYNGSLATLAASGESDGPARIGLVSGHYFALVDRLAELVATGRSQQAALELGTSERPGGVEARLQAELARADRAYGADATRSREVASIGTVIAIVLLLVGVLGHAALLGSRASAQPPRRDDRRPHRPRQPPQAVRRHGAPGRRRRGARGRHVRSRRLQGLQRHLRPPGRRCPARSPRRATARGTGRPRQRVQDRRRRVRGDHGGRRRRAAPARRPGSAERTRPGLRDRLLARLVAHPRRSHAGAGPARRRSAPLRRQALRGRASRERCKGRAAPGARRAERDARQAPRQGRGAGCAHGRGHAPGAEAGRADTTRRRVARRGQERDPERRSSRRRARSMPRSGASWSATVRSASAS